MLKDCAYTRNRDKIEFLTKLGFVCVDETNQLYVNNRIGNGLVEFKFFDSTKEDIASIIFNQGRIVNSNMVKAKITKVVQDYFGDTFDSELKL